MPIIGGVDVPDQLMPRISVPERERPGLAAVFGAAAEGTYKQLKAALPYQFEVLTRDRVDPGLEQRYQRGLEEASTAFRRAAPADLSDATSGRVGIGRFVAENVAASLPQMIGVGAGALAGSLAGPGGAAAGGIAAGIPIFSSSNVARAVQEHGKLDVGAAERSAAWAPFQAAADVAGEAAVLRRIPGAGRIFGVADAGPGSFVRRTLRSVAEAGGTEAATEAAQQLGERSAAGVPITNADAVGEYVNAAVTAFAVGGALGVGGGFHRTNAVAKPPDMVTNADLHEAIDGILNGSLRAVPPEQQLGLPLEGGSATEQQPQLLAAEQPEQEVLPSQLPQLPLDPALSTVPPGTQLELGDRFRDNITPQELPTDRGVQVPDATEEALRAIGQQPSPRAAALASTALSRGIEGAPVSPEASVGVPDEAFRPFRSDKIEDIEAAIRDKRSPPSLVADAQRELSHRAEEAAGSRELSTDKFQTRLDELKRGLRGGFVQKLEAASPAELVQKVYDEVFTNSNTQSNVIKFAQRLGVLDEKLQPGPAAKALEAQRAAAEQAGTVAPGETPDPAAPAAPAAPAPVITANEKVDPDFAQQWQDTLKEAGIERMRVEGLRGTPPNLQAARAQVFRMLGEDTSNAQVSQVEKLARKMGLVTDDDAMDVTPLGRQAFLTTPEGLEETVSAAQQQGFTGKQASMFERGARSTLGHPAETTFSDFSDMAAHEAGKVWAQDFVRNASTRTAAQTNAIQARQAARQTGKAVDRKAVARAELTPQQVQQASLNRLIDSADLRTVSDTDVASLRRMVREGASAEEVGAALQQVQGGKTLFKEAPRAAYAAPAAQPLTRSQPLFKEMNTPTETSKAQQRMETEGALQTADLRRLLQMVVAEKAMTARRAEKLNQMLDEGKVLQVQKIMDKFDPGPDVTAAFGERRLTRRDGPGRRAAPRSDDRLGFADAQLERDITGKSFTEVLDHMIETAPSVYHQALMRGMLALANKLEKGGTKFSIHIAKAGDEVPGEMTDDMRAITRMSKVPSVVEVWVKSAELGDEAGMNYQVLAHEALHAVTLMITDFYKGRAVAANDELGHAVRNLEKLAEAVIAHFEARAESGARLNEFEQAVIDKGRNAFADTDEVLSWGMTNPDMQRYLASIEYAPRQSVWGKFVDLIRRVIGSGNEGIEVKHNTALAELMRVAERITNASQTELNTVFLRNRYEEAGGRRVAAMQDSSAGHKLNRRNFLSGIAAAAAAATVDKANAKIAPLTRTAPVEQLKALVGSGNIVGTLQHLQTHSTDRGYRDIARKLLAAGGWDKVTMATGEDQGSLYGETRLNDDGSSSVELYGKHGLEEETILHELLHAFVQQRWAGLSVYTEHNERLLDAQGDRGDEVIRHFDKLWNTIGDTLVDAGLVEKEAWAENFHADPDEAFSWMMTNKQAQAYLKTVDAEGNKVADSGKSLWEDFKKWISELLGVDYRRPDVRTALDELLDAGHAILDVGKDVRTGDFSTKFAEGLAKQAGRMEMRVSAANRTVGAANDVTKGLAGMVDKVTGGLNLSEMGIKARRATLGWLSRNQMDRQFGSAMPGLLMNSDAHREQAAVRGRFEQMTNEVLQEYAKLERSNKNAAEWVSQLMAASTRFQLDPEKSWADQSDAVKNSPRAAELKSVHDQMAQLVNNLQRGDGEGMRVFREFRAINEAQQYALLAARLHGLVAMDPELALGVENAAINPVDTFVRETGLTTPAAIRDRWDKLLHDQLTAVRAFVEQKKGEAAAGTANDQAAMQQHLMPVEMQVAATYEALEGSKKAPYFHLGRFGDYFGSATVKNTKGVVDADALEKVAARLEKAGFTDAQISGDTSKSRVMMRFDTADQAKRFEQEARALQQEGLLAEDDILSGPRTVENDYGTPGGLPAFLQRYIQAISTSAAFIPHPDATVEEREALEKQKHDAVRVAVDTWLEGQPDTSLSKVLTKRYTVPGFNKDMVRNFAHRGRVGAIGIANAAAAPKFNAADVAMRGQVNEAKSSNNPNDQYLLSDLFSEVKKREATNPINDGADAFDKLRAYSHAYFLGMSPAYGLVNMTQLGVTALPELAKKYGYTKSFHAMRRAGNVAFKVLKAVASEAQKLGPAHWADVAITEGVLEKAGLSEQERNFVMQMLATGSIDISSAARALGQISENRVGSKRDLALKYASAIGMYTETFSRLLTAIAAGDLHGGNVEDATKYAREVVSNSMFDYDNWNTARQLGKRGFLGPVTPLVTQFMSYSVQLTEKLYSEMMSAAGRQRAGESPEQTKQRAVEAWRFLMGHLTAVTALAGTLGFPFASVFAAALERLVDAGGDDDEPYDATAAWRGFLSDVLGKDVAEVVSRGLPRALGFDISQRAGEQDLLPFSQFIGDRRSWRDSIESMLGRSIGASPNMLMNIAEGGEQIAQGDILGGMKSVLPTALKGPTEAYRMTTDGYIDTKGNKLPISPRASSILWQLLGFTPSEKAEYAEARGDQMARRGEVTREASRLRQQIIKAMLQGDRDRAAELVTEAQQFDNDNPAFAVIPSLVGSLQRQMQSRARAQALRAPLGVSINDLAGQNMTRYANVDYTAR